MLLLPLVTGEMQQVTHDRQQIFFYSFLYWCYNLHMSKELVCLFWNFEIIVHQIPHYVT